VRNDERSRPSIGDASRNSESSRGADARWRCATDRPSGWIGTGRDAGSVDSPMTPSDYVKAIHIFNEKNPQPNVIGVHLGPRAGRARFSTRIRLADTQRVIAIAQLSDGSFWCDSVDVVITLGACLEDS
jgi:hypothetical protein